MRRKKNGYGSSDTTQPLTSPAEGSMNNARRGEHEGSAPTMKYAALFTALYVAAQVMGISAIVLITCWMGLYRGGFGFQDRPKNEFRFHPLLMSFALLFINGEAILLYRAFRTKPKVYTKAAHAALQFIALIIVSMGLKAVLDSHNLNKDEKTGALSPITNFHSIHSWVGLVTVTIFAVQFLGGFFLFYKPGASIEMRKALMPSHRLAGLIIFVMSLSGVLMGLAQLSAWTMKCWTEDGVICGEMWVANLFGLAVVSYGGLVIYLVSHPDWVRQPMPSEVSPPMLKQRLQREEDVAEHETEVDHR